MKENNAQVRAALERTRLVTDWPKAAVDELCADAEVRSYGDGERALAAGDFADAFWIAADGSFLLSKSWQNGRRFVYSFLRPGHTVGMMSVFGGISTPFDVSARGRAAAVVVPGRALRAVAARYPEAALQIISYVSRQRRADLDAVELHATNSVRCRIAKTILWFAQGQSGRTDTEIVIDPRISQEDLADLVCAARQSVNRELRRLMREGVLKQRYRTLVILDRDKLARVAQEDEAPEAPVPGRSRPAGADLRPTTD